MFRMQHSPTEVLRAELEAWRKELDWSREALAQQVVEHHVGIGADLVTGIRFQVGGDAFANMRTNAMRLKRWLDGEEGSPALPADMVPTLLATLPMPRRLRAAVVLLGDAADLVVSPRAIGAGGLSPLALLAETQKESAEAAQALVALAQAPTLDMARVALCEVAEAEAAMRHAKTELEAAIVSPDLLGRV